MSSLSDEIEKRDAFLLKEQEAHLNIVRTAAWLDEPFERLFREHGLSGPLYNILRILRGAGRATPCGEIARRMITPAPDVTRLVNRLEKLGLAERGRGPDDGRVVLVCLTPKGKRALAKLDRPVEQLHRDTLGDLSESDLKAINRLMVKVRRAVRGSEPG